MLFFLGFQIDQQRAELRGPDGQTIKLRPKSFGMLQFLAANAGRVLTKQELMEAFWPGLHVGEDSLFQCIREVRTALGDERRQIIKNVSGRGYLFEADVTDDEAGQANPAEPPSEAAATIASIAPVLAASDAAAARRPWWRSPRFGSPVGIAAAAGLGAVAGIAVAVMIVAPERIFSRSPPAIAVLPIAPSGDDPQTQAMAAGATDRLTQGLARIENIRVVAPPEAPAQAGFPVVSRWATTADYVVKSELQKTGQGWTLRARMTRISTGQIDWASTVEVSSEEADLQTQQSRLAAGLGHPLALHLNAVLNDRAASAAKSASSAQIAVTQATASINQTTPERFRAAQSMLEKAIAADPDDVDLQAALAALQLRGIQMAWYTPEERAAAKNQGQTLLERALRAKPSYIPVLEGYCRFLSATNHFVESLVACARTLSFDPWDGMGLYLIGLAQFQLGRFDDAVATFKQADQFDTPAVSRWTWLLGAGVTYALMGRNEDAVPWLQRSLAVTPGTGRTHLALAAAYQRLGRRAEAQAMIAKALELRPGATADNIGPPTENTSPVYLEAFERLKRALIEAGLPER